MKKTVIILSSIALVLGLTGCGSGSTEWGIDQSSIPQCNQDINDSSVAISVPAGTPVVAVAPNTQLRIWHYSNGDKLMCVVSGEAVMSGGV